MHPLAVRTHQQLAVRSQIENLESSLHEEIDSGRIEQTIVNCKEDNSQAHHYFGDGVYCRSLLIPKNTVVVGHLHKQARVCIIAQGTCTFVDEFRKETVSAPWIGEFKAGSKTVVLAHEDTLWVACLGTDEKDADVIVGELLAEDHQDYERYLMQLEHHQEDK